MAKPRNIPEGMPLWYSDTTSGGEMTLEGAERAIKEMTPPVYQRQRGRYARDATQAPIEKPAEQSKPEPDTKPDTVSINADIWRRAKEIVDAASKGEHPGSLAARAGPLIKIIRRM